MMKFQGIIFIMVGAGIYLIFGRFMGDFAFIGSLVLAAIITFGIVRASWEQDILKNLSEADKGVLEDRISAAEAELVKSNERFKKKLEAHDNYKDTEKALEIVHQSFEDAYVITLGILADLHEDTKQSVIGLFQGAGRSPFDKKLVRQLDRMLSESYRIVYGNMTTNLPFPRMYSKIVQSIYLEHINDNGVMARFSQLREQ